jgi:hypothetical protein
MNKKIKLTLFLSVLIGKLLIAQQTIPVIKATSDKVDIKDGNNFYKATWTITPKLKPDIYTTLNNKKKITFYTDIDSISFNIKPNKKYNFIILLNNKDSAFTQIITRESYLKVLKKSNKYNLKIKIIFQNSNINQTTILI